MRVQSKVAEANANRYLEIKWHGNKSLLKFKSDAHI